MFKQVTIGLLTTIALGALGMSIGAHDADAWPSRAYGRSHTSDADVRESIVDAVRESQSGFQVNVGSDLDINGDSRVTLSDVIMVRNFDQLSWQQQYRVRAAVVAAVRNQQTGFARLNRSHSLDVNNDHRIDLTDVAMVRNALR